MAKTATVACPQCGAENEVTLPEETFDDSTRRAWFSFACRVCGAPLPTEETPTSEPGSRAKPS
jgi:hypothetical protein